MGVGFRGLDLGGFPMIFKLNSNTNLFNNFSGRGHQQKARTVGNHGSCLLDNAIGRLGTWFDARLWKSQSSHVQSGPRFLHGRWVNRKTTIIAQFSFLFSIFLSINKWAVASFVLWVFWGFWLSWNFQNEFHNSATASRTKKPTQKLKTKRKRRESN